MSGQMDVVTVRRLPDGEPQPARIESGKRRQIRITLAGNAGRDFPVGALVEAQSPEAVFLGEILERQDLCLVVAVEHAINRAALSEIEDVWRRPPEA